MQEFREQTHLATGAIGKPGKRVFYLQLGDYSGNITLKAEKQQIVAIAQMFKKVLQDFPPGEVEDAMTSPVEPIEPLWAVGQLGIGVHAPTNQVVLIVDPYVADENDETEAESFKVHLSAQQARNFVKTTEILLAASRPPCKLCGLPKGNDHICPRLN